MRDVGTILILSAAVTLIVGFVLLATVSAIVGGIVILVGVSDLGLGLAFRAGMLGGGG